MEDTIDKFYKKIINTLINTSVISKVDKLLVVCGGIRDKNVLLDAGFEDVVISNLDSRMESVRIKPFTWQYQDVENLKYKNNHFDFCIVHDGLHHCHSPHKGMCEMYRVSKRGFLMFEPKDTFISRLGVKLNIGQEYEHAAVYYNDCRSGGVANSDLPNYVYRWTEGEIIKTISALEVRGRPSVKFFHHYQIPWGQIRGRKNPLVKIAMTLLMPFVKISNMLMPSQSNYFAALVLKPDLRKNLHPWLINKKGKIRVNSEWLGKHYG